MALWSAPQANARVGTGTRAAARRARRDRIRRLARLGATAVVLGALGACHSNANVLDPAGPVGAQDKQILLDAVVIMLVIVVPTIVATLWFAWWYRASNRRARYLPNWSYSGRIELVVWSIPLLVILFLGGMIWVSAHELDPRQPVPGRGPPLRIQAVSLDWKWLFIYPDQGIASVNRLVLPVGAPVSFQLTSGSVMTVFFVPRLGTMIYTMNGMVTPLNLRVDQPGAFYGEAAHFSGDGFADMNFTTDAVPPAQFAAWAAGVRAAAGPVLNGAAYESLSRQSTHVAPFTYRTVQPGLFEDIATQRLPPGPGPAPSATPKTPELAQQGGG